MYISRTSITAHGKKKDLFHHALAFITPTDAKCAQIFFSLQWTLPNGGKSLNKSQPPALLILFPLLKMSTYLGKNAVSPYLSILCIRFNTKTTYRHLQFSNVSSACFSHPYCLWVSLSSGKHGVRACNISQQYFTFTDINLLVYKQYDLNSPFKASVCPLNFSRKL